jgi:F-type H+-transporting ATPase subunit b
LEALGINLGYLLVQLFNFAIMFIVINAWVVKPILKMLENRRQTVAQGLEDARIAAEARANAEKEAKGILEKAQADAAQVIRDANERADKLKVDQRSAAEAEIAKAKEEAMKDVQLERNRILAELRSQVVALSIAGAQKLIGDSLMQDEKRQHALLDEFFSGVKNGKLVVMEGVEYAGDKAEITSALPLTEEEQQAVRNEVLPSLHPEANVLFHVDPTILGGLVLRVGDRVVDRSVSGQLQTLRESLQ